MATRDFALERRLRHNAKRYIRLRNWYRRKVGRENGSVVHEPCRNATVLNGCAKLPRQTSRDGFSFQDGLELAIGGHFVGANRYGGSHGWIRYHATRSVPARVPASEE